MNKFASSLIISNIEFIWQSNKTTYQNFSYVFMIAVPKFDRFANREGPWGIDPRKSPGFPRPRGDGAGTGIGLQNLRGQGGDGEH